MSLVVARLERAGVRLLCDTQITDPSQARSRVLPGRLKLILLNPRLCVGYAGQPNVAVDSIRDLTAARDAREVATALLEQHRRFDGAADFLVASLQPPVLIKIGSGQLFAGAEQYWIGDIDAVRVFEEHYRRVHVPATEQPEYDLAAKLLQAFQATVGDPRAQTVGGLMFHVVTDPPGFRYAPGANVFFPPQTIPSDEWVPLRFGGAAHGGYAYSIYAPEATGVAAAGAYFLQGRCGLLYRPLAEDDGRWITRVSQDQFRHRISEECGTEMTGITFG